MSMQTYPQLRTIVPKEPPAIPVPEYLSKLPACFTAYGCRGSGKSTFISSMLRAYKREGCAHRIMLICPTYGSNAFLWDGLVDPEDVYEDATQASLDAVVAKTIAEAEEFRIYQEQHQVWKKFKRQEREVIAGKRQTIEEPVLGSALDAGLTDLKTYPPYKYPGCQHPCVWCVIDDAMSSSLFNPSTRVKNNLSNVIIKHRHIGGRQYGGLSLVIALQSYKAQTGVLSRAIRGNCTGMILWGMRDEKMLDEIHSEISREMDKETFFALYDYCTSSSPHDCCFLEFGSHPRVRRNLDEIILLPKGALSAPPETKKSNGHTKDGKPSVQSPGAGVDRPV